MNSKIRSIYLISQCSLKLIISVLLQVHVYYEIFVRIAVDIGFLKREIYDLFILNVKISKTKDPLSSQAITDDLRET